MKPKRTLAQYIRIYAWAWKWKLGNAVGNFMENHTKLFFALCVGWIYVSYKFFDWFFSFLADKNEAFYYLVTYCIGLPAGIIISALLLYWFVRGVWAFVNLEGTRSWGIGGTYWGPSLFEDILTTVANNKIEINIEVEKKPEEEKPESQDATPSSTSL